MTTYVSIPGRGKNTGKTYFVSNLDVTITDVQKGLMVLDNNNQPAFSINRIISNFTYHW